MKLKLQQGQVWKKGEEFLRIVHLERLEVKYKTVKDLAEREGSHHHVTKKEFCRLIKGATLLSAEEVKTKQAGTTADPGPTAC
jgi:hypothetical protein